MILLAMNTLRRRHTQSDQYVQEGEQKARWHVEGVPTSLSHYLYLAAPTAAATLTASHRYVGNFARLCSQTISRKAAAAAEGKKNKK
jgi:hypothetical protein